MNLDMHNSIPMNFIDYIDVVGGNLLNLVLACKMAGSFLMTALFLLVLPSPYSCHEFTKVSQLWQQVYSPHETLRDMETALMDDLVELLLSHDGASAAGGNASVLTNCVGGPDHVRTLQADC